MKLIPDLFLCARENEDAVCFHHFRTDITESLKDPDAIMNDQLEHLGFVGRLANRPATAVEGMQGPQ